MKDNKIISLFLDTASKNLAVSCTLDKEEKIVPLGDNKKALERTHLGLQVLMEKMDFTLKDVDKIYTLLGPGSNTGIRLGLTIPRTMYAFNPNLQLYGINTLKLLLAGNKEGISALSDRSGNLFIGRKKEGEYSFEKIEKTAIETLPHDQTYFLEKEDVVAHEKLASYTVEDISIINQMMEYCDEFEDFSKKEEEYLPEYLQQI